MAHRRARGLSACWTDSGTIQPLERPKNFAALREGVLDGDEGEAAMSLAVLSMDDAFMHS